MTGETDTPAEIAAELRGVVWHDWHPAPGAPDMAAMKREAAMRHRAAHLIERRAAEIAEANNLISMHKTLVEFQTAEIARLRDVNERDRSKVAVGLTAIRQAITRREWLRIGRGSYEWNDDRWMDEFGQAIDEVLAAAETLNAVARDWSDCPTKWAEIQAARAPLPTPTADKEGWGMGEPVNLIGIDGDTAFLALVMAFTTVCTVADRPTSEEGTESVTDNGFDFEPHEMIAFDRDAYIGLARDTRDQIVALIRQSRGEPANTNAAETH